MLKFLIKFCILTSLTLVSCGKHSSNTPEPGIEDGHAPVTLSNMQPSVDPFTPYPVASASALNCNDISTQIAKKSLNFSFEFENYLGHTQKSNYTVDLELVNCSPNTSKAILNAKKLTGALFNSFAEISFADKKGTLTLYQANRCVGVTVDYLNAELIKNNVVMNDSIFAALYENTEKEFCPKYLDTLAKTIIQTLTK